LSLAELLFGTQLIQMLQQLLAPEFDRIFLAISVLGSDQVLVALTAIVYWCFDKRYGRLVTYILFLGAYLNVFLKVLILWPRPPVELRIADKSATSFGFPSGHAQDSATFWTALSGEFRSRILAAAATIVVLAVGISRIHLGAHYPAQVVGGWLIGFAVASLAILIVRHLKNQDGRIRIGPHLVFTFAALLPFAIGVVAFGTSSEFNPGGIGGYLLGFSLGAIVEDRYLGFSTNIDSMRRIFRIFLGVAITGSVVFVLSRPLPEAYVLTSFINAFIRGMMVVFIVPAVFRIIERRIS